MCLIILYNFKGVCSSIKPIFSHSTYRSKLDKGRYEEAFKFLKDFVESEALEGYYTEQEVKKIVEHVLYTTFNHLEEGQVDLKKLELNKFQILSMIGMMYSLEDLRNFIEKVLGEIYNQVIEASPGDYSMILQIYQYIDTNY